MKQALNNKHIFELLLVLLFTTLTIFSFIFNGAYIPQEKLIEQFKLVGGLTDIVWCFLIIAIFVFYYFSRNKFKYQIEESIFAILLASIMLLGKSFSMYNNWDLIFFSNKQTFQAMIAGIGWWRFFYTVLCWITRYVNKYSTIKCLGKCLKEQHLQVKFFLIILLGWLPYIVINAPGSVTIDGIRQISMWFKYQQMTNHHPFFSTMFFGVLMQIGRVFSDNMGVLIIVLIQSLICAMIYSYLCVRVAAMCGKKIACYSVAFFSIVPLWGAYATTVVKDTLFTAVFALYFCGVLDIFNSSKVPHKWMRFILLNIAVCIIRNDGIYRILPICIALFFVMEKERRHVFFVTIGICFFLFLYNFTLFGIMGIEKGSSREMLSIPFQQTARYARDCTNDITDAEMEKIKRILPYEDLGDSYNPELSDPVKNRAIITTSGSLKGYFSAWATMGMRHPGVYIQATINNTYGYFYPFYNSQAATPFKNYIAGEAKERGFNIHYLFKNEVRSKIRNYEEFWRVLPGVTLILNPATYTWIVFFIIMYLIKVKKIRGLVVMGVPLLHIAVCMASPVNGYLRYALPLIACMPLLIAWFLSYVRKRESI